MKKALITGITGQDGSYPAEFLLSNGYEVMLEGAKKDELCQRAGFKVYHRNE